MKFLYMIALLAVTLTCTPALASDAPSEGPSPEQQKLLKDCNLTARNSLINGDVKAVEDACTKAIREMKKSYPDKEYMINPMLNLAFTYSMGGYYDRAKPLLKRAKEIGQKLYKPGSKELKAIEDFIKDQEDRKNNPPKFNNSGVKSPH